MNPRKTVEVVRTALELVVEQGRFSTTELINHSDCALSNSETEEILFYLEDAGWIQKSGNEGMTWIKGSSGREYLGSASTDHNAFRVLPDEIPDDESFR